MCSIGIVLYSHPTLWSLYQMVFLFGRATLQYENPYILESAKSPLVSVDLEVIHPMHSFIVHANDFSMLFFHRVPVGMANLF
jgi:hypothetical protein